MEVFYYKNGHDSIPAAAKFHACFQRSNCVSIMCKHSLQPQCILIDLDILTGCSEELNRPENTSLKSIVDRLKSVKSRLDDKTKDSASLTASIALQNVTKYVALACCWQDVRPNLYHALSKACLTDLYMAPCFTERERQACQQTSMCCDAGYGPISWSDLEVLSAKVANEAVWRNIKKARGVPSSGDVISSAFGAAWPVKLGRLDTDKPDPEGRLPKPDASVPEITVSFALSSFSPRLSHSPHCLSKFGHEYSYDLKRMHIVLNST